MKIKQVKKVLKEDEGLSTPKPINKYDNSDIEKTINGVLEKSFEDFELVKYQHQGETQYINLNISTELPEIKDDLEFKRYLISLLLVDFKQKFTTELSKFLNVVNINNGPYQFVKGSDKILFNTTILLSDNNISDWVSGVKKRTESNKQIVKESKQMKNSEEKSIRKVLTILYEQILKEKKITKSFNTSKDEFEIKDSLKKKGIKANVEKAGVVRVSWNDKKISESEIKKFVESKNLGSIKKILEKLHESVLLEARPQKKEQVISEPLTNDNNAPVVEPKKIDKVTENRLKKTIRDYNSLRQEMDALEEEHQRFMEKRNIKEQKLYSLIYDTMKSIDMNLYVVDEIVAKLTKEFDKPVTQYAKAFDEILLNVNKDTAKIIKEIKEKHTKSSTIQSRLSVEQQKVNKKPKRNESIIKEGIFDWFKSIYYSFKNYLSNLTSNRKALQKLAKQTGLI